MFSMGSIRYNSIKSVHSTFSPFNHVAGILVRPNKSSDHSKIAIQTNKCKSPKYINEDMGNIIWYGRIIMQDKKVDKMADKNVAIQDKDE